jgi:hypothetical protein
VQTRQNRILLAIALLASWSIVAIISLIDQRTGFLVIIKGLLEALIVLFVLMIASQNTQNYMTKLEQLVIGFKIATVIYSVASQVSFWEFLARSYATIWGILFAYCIFVVIQSMFGENKKKRKRKRNYDDRIHDLEDLLP